MSVLTAFFFNSLNELVKDDKNGLVFETSQDLAEQFKVNYIQKFLCY